ncbi:MAG TPA: hypothetical protein VGQ62_21220 [Chloroflexota bacterium]|jgi:hypothetical protein|nr:hypothetical protein [Chloroflexota bacterium]
MAAVSAVTVVGAPPANVAQMGDRQETDASIAAYNLSGERMLRVMDLTWKTCVGLLALVALAWVFGVLPGAVRVF